MYTEEKNFQPKERRRHKRYPACDGAFAAISPNSYKLGQIINISRGGIAFQYINSERPTLNHDIEETHIFLSSKGHYVQGIPVKQVSDYAVPNTNPYSTLNMRQCAVQFGEMSMEQIINLDNYILNNTRHFAMA